MESALLTALAEPNRLRIVELLGAAPRAVGEIATALGVRQPQVTKHLQTLERAGLVTMHPLGQRRIYALRREPLRELAAWLGALEDDHPSEDVLVRYQAAIDAERARDPADGARSFAFTRRLRAPRDVVWDAWTTEDGVRGWWSPEHFTVADCDVEPVVGGALRIVLAEGDGNRHVALGRFHAVDRPSALSFDLAPLGPGDVPLFSAVHEVRLTTRRGAGTELSLTIDVTGARPEVAPAVAGMEPGWEQLLDKLAVAVGG